MLVEQEMEAEHGLIIDLYNYAIENLHTRFKITDDHLTASLLDPTQKKLTLLDKYVEMSLSETKEKLRLCQFF